MKFNLVFIDYLQVKTAPVVVLYLNKKAPYEFWVATSIDQESSVNGYYLLAQATSDEVQKISVGEIDLREWYLNKSEIYCTQVYIIDSDLRPLENSRDYINLHLGSFRIRRQDAE